MANKDNQKWCQSIKKSWLILKLENWAWAQGHLGNIAEKAHQLNLLGEKRKREGKRGEEKKKGTKRRERREHRKVGGGKECKKKREKKK